MCVCVCVCVCVPSTPSTAVGLADEVEEERRRMGKTSRNKCRSAGGKSEMRF